MEEETEANADSCLIAGNAIELRVTKKLLKQMQVKPQIVVRASLDQTGLQPSH
jgi:hypothetical protein